MVSSGIKLGILIMMVTKKVIKELSTHVWLDLKSQSGVMIIKYGIMCIY